MQMYNGSHDSMQGDGKLSMLLCMLQVTKGADVVQMIEKVKTDRFDKPFEEVKIINIDIMAALEGA